MVRLAVVVVVGRLVLSKYLLSVEVDCILYLNRSRSAARLRVAALEALPVQSGLLARVPVRPACSSRPGLLLSASGSSLAAKISNRVFRLHVGAVRRTALLCHLLSVRGRRLTTDVGTVFLHDIREMQDLLSVSGVLQHLRLCRDTMSRSGSMDVSAVCGSGLAGGLQDELRYRRPGLLIAE